MATHSSVLAQEIPRTEEPGGLQSMGSQESNTIEWLHDNNSPVFFPGGSHGQRSLVAYSPWGSQRVRQDWAANTFIFTIVVVLPSCVSVCSFAHSCLTVCSHMHHSPPGSSVNGILQAKNWSGLPYSLPGDLPNPVAPTLANEFFTSEPLGKPLLPS